MPKDPRIKKVLVIKWPGVPKRAKATLQGRIT